MISWLVALSVPFCLSAIWFYTLHNAPRPSLANQRITLLIAHPDDEAMFFAPTLLSLTKPSLNNTVSVVCFSSGNADRLGHIRRQELIRSCLSLGISSTRHITTIEHPDLQDSMTTFWPASTISSLLSSHHPSLDTLITFDESGVSSHPNHISLLRGAQEYISTAPSPNTARLYTLTSVPIWRKYMSILDGPLSLARGGGGRMVIVSSPGEYRRAQKAMTEAHVSQMRWFRWGWIVLSRYMVVNDLVLRQ